MSSCAGYAHIGYVNHVCDFPLVSFVASGLKLICGYDRFEIEKGGKGFVAASRIQIPLALGYAVSAKLQVANVDCVSKSG